MLIVFHRRSEIDVTNSKTLCGNVTSSTKPEVHNVAQRCRRRNEARVEVRPCGFPDIRADRQTNRPTDILITILRIHPGESRKQSKQKNESTSSSSSSNNRWRHDSNPLTTMYAYIDDRCLPDRPLSYLCDVTAGRHDAVLMSAVSWHTGTAATCIIYHSPIAIGYCQSMCDVAIRQWMVWSRLQFFFLYAETEVIRWLTVNIWLDRLK